MGQEASVPLPDGGHYPQHHEDHSTNGGGKGTTAAARASAKALGNMIRRGGGGGNETGGGGGGGGPIDFSDREAARAAAAGGHFAMSVDGGSVVSSSTAADYNTDNTPPHHPEQQTTTSYHQYPTTAASQMTPEQQQAYLMQKQYEQQQRMNQQRQQQAYNHHQQQPFSNGGGGGIPPPPPPPPPPLHHQQRSPPTTDAAASVTIMMTESSVSNKSGGGRGGGKLPGTRLINSMKNLAISAKGAVAHADQQQHVDVSSVGSSGYNKSPLATSGHSVSDWQRQWEDDDESDNEDEMDMKMPAAKTTTTATAMHSSPLRPGGMEDLYSAATAAVGGPAMTAVGRASPERGESATMSTTTTAVPSPTKDGVIRTVPPSSSNSKQHYDRQLSDGVEWDTAKQIIPPRKEKPSIDMFLPMLRVLGKGSFGKVVLVQKNCGGDVGQLFAMKILKKEYLKKRRQVERTQTERKVLQAVNHPFIMKMHYAFQSEDKLFFVLDYCAGGELFFHLSRFRRFPERVARFYTSELLLAIGHLHKRGIIYRDLKPENVLIDADGHVKLGDFGLAKTGIHHPCEGAMSMCGTPEYMAPEVLLQSGHGFCVDYWGIGMLVYEMMTGLPPWYTTDRAKLFRRLKSAPLEIPSFFSEQCADCVGAFLERSPRRRLGYRGLKSAMEHPFFRPINFRALYARRIDPPIRPCDGWNEQDALAAINSPTGGANETRDALDRATANFDQTFTNMPVDQEDDSVDDYDDGASYETHDDNYVGFTYDDEDFQLYASSVPSRQRTHHGYHQSKE